MAVSKQDVLAWLAVLAASLCAKIEQLLTDLDSAIGDADHGINMDRGFTAVKAELAPHVPDRSPLHFSDRGGRPHPQRRRRRRAAIRHFLPARQHGVRRKNRARRPMSWRCFRRASRVSSSAVRPRRRQNDGRCLASRPGRPCERALEDGSGLAEILDAGRGGGRSGYAGDHSHAGAQRPRQLFGRAQHRPPGSRRDLVLPAAEELPRRPGAHDRLRHCLP